MHKFTKLVLELLKPKASHLGFTKEELEGVADNIANNLGVADDATEEAVKEAVTKAVNATLPFLELSQKSANRIIQKNKEEREKADEEARKKAEEARQKAEEEASRAVAEKAEAERKAKEEAAAKKAEEERIAAEEAARIAAEEAGFKKLLDSDWAKGLKAENEKLIKQLKERDARDKERDEREKKQMAEFKAFRDEFNALKAERIKTTREKKLNTLLEGSGRFGDSIKKNYARMTFNNDEDFNEFLVGVEDDLKAFNQERADKGLETLGSPSKGDKTEVGKVEPMTDAEIDALAAIM